MLNWLLILAGMVEALWGLGQVYGYLPVKHAMFPLTGSFYNPGPYGGFLAMTFPVCLWEVLSHYRHRRKGLAYWTSLVGLILIGIMIPATMSRTAWVAVAISSVYVCGNVYPTEMRFLGKRLSQKCKHWKVLALLLVLAVGSATYLMKKDSADGRLLMWKVAVHAIVKQPLTGYGWDNVSGAYGQAQEEYFAKGDYTETEALVAGTPEYVFNEYLQAAIAWGIPVAVILIGITCIAFWGFARSVHGKGKAATLLSLMIFSVASYPFQFMVFIACWGLLVICGIQEVCVLKRQISYKYIRIGLQTTVGVCCILVLSVQYRRYESEQEWDRLRIAYRLDDYETVRTTYTAYENELEWNASYNFEYAHACQKLGDYFLSDSLFFRTLKVSSDPMVLNMLGKNYQAEGKYVDAENYFIRSTYRLPNRIYPYFLLVKLYAERPDVFPKKKLEWAARMVLEKEPKVQSTAIREMREEVRRIITTTLTVESEDICR